MGSGGGPPNRSVISEDSFRSLSDRPSHRSAYGHTEQSEQLAGVSRRPSSEWMSIPHEVIGQAWKMR